MNSMNKSMADAKARFLVLVTALCVLSFTARVQTRDAASIVCSSMNRIHQVEHDTRDLVQLSIRMYRFYKLSAEAPQARANVN
ncbi:MAG: hypothetical protein ACXVZV_07470 [Terriglobales bacterium]